MKILFVCLGNICRSPLAEGLLRSKINDLPIETDSAGTSGFHEGENPDHRAVHIGRKYAVDISKLVGRQFTKEDFDRFDIIYAMDRQNLKNILKLASQDEHRSKVRLLMNVLYPGSDGEVPDPFYGGPEGFESVFQLLDEATDRIIELYNLENGRK